VIAATSVADGVRRARLSENRSTVTAARPTATTAFARKARLKRPPVVGGPWSADRRRRCGSPRLPFPRRHRRQGGHATVQRHERYARCPRGEAPTTPAAAAAVAATACFSGAERLGDGGEEVPRPLGAAADTPAAGGDSYHVELVQAVHVVGSVRVECHVPADAVPSAAGRHTGAPAADSGRPPVGRRDGRRSHPAIATWA